MYDNSVITELKKQIGWRNHWDLTEIPALPTSLTDSESGKVYQNYSRLLRLDYIESLLPSNQSLTDYLDKVETDAINNFLTKLQAKKSLMDNTKVLLTNDIVYHSSIVGQTITNQGRFVGIEFCIDGNMGVRAVINRIGLYLNAVQGSLTLYLFNSLQPTAINTYTYTGTTANAFEWLEQTITIDYTDGTNNSGAVWYLGYYQDDLVGNAIRYKKLNWKNGYCGSCNKDAYLIWKKMNKYVSMRPFYIAQSNVPGVPTDRFDINDIVYDDSNNYGFNLNISVKCNISQFLIDNRSVMRDAIGMSVVLEVLKMYVSSGQVSATEQNVQIIALRMLEGASDTKAVPFEKTVDSYIGAVNLETGNTNNSPCLPCSRKGSSIGVL